MTRYAIIAVARTPMMGPDTGTTLRPDDAVGQLLSDVYAHRLVMTEHHTTPVIIGTAVPEAEQGWMFAQSALRNAQVAEGTPTWCVSAGAASGMVALQQAMDMINAGRAPMVVAIGADFPSRVPPMGYNPSFNPRLREEEPSFFTPPGMSAEHLINRYRLQRDELDEWATESRRRAARTKHNGGFLAELVPLKQAPEPGELHPVTMSEDTLIPEQELGVMAAEAPLYVKGGGLTAANCAPLAGGASAVAICSMDHLETIGLHPLAVISDLHVESLRSARTAEAGIKAAETLLAKNELNIDEIDEVIIDEPQASIPLALARHFSLPLTGINPRGGSLAMGNCLGASGLRMIVSQAVATEQHDISRSLIAQYGDGGLGVACLMERGNE